MPDTLASLSEKITGAELAQKKWRAVSLNERIKFIEKFNDALLKHKKEFVKLLISEIFKPRAHSTPEVERTIEMVVAFCEEAQSVAGEVRESGNYRGFKNNKTAIIKRQPLGTVLCISPFNYPLDEAVAKIVPALLMGNAVLFKPASVGFKVGELIARCMEEAGMPNFVFNFINLCRGRPPGRPACGQTGRSVPTNLYDYLVSHPLIDCINFTGSTEVAEHISHICGIKKLVFGLSGKDASLVLADADLTLAAREIVSGAFSYSGQRCTGIKRVLVAKKIHDELINNLKLIINKTLIAGDLNDEKTTFGPVISVKQAEYINELVDDAENLGASAFKFQISNFKLGQDKWDNQFMLPTLVDRVTTDMRVAWEEPFGPILPITVFDTSEEAIKLCNQSSFGLQNSVFTTNINLAFEVAERLECGVVQINGKDARGPDNFPFLGVKKSGLGIVGGIKYLLNEMSTIKSVVVNINSHV